MARRILNEISERLEFLNAVGLGYLSLDRSASSLSSGESQRIRLATQIGSKLRGVLYVLDEPSIGLHPRDNQRLLETLEQLRDMSNTVLVVEHDEETIRRADYVIDLGPGAGKQGGYVVAAGPPEKIATAAESLTGKYLSGELSIPVPATRRVANGKFLTVLGARANNLKNIDVAFPFGLLTVVTGVSGSGKSTLVNDILHRAIAKKLYRAIEDPGEHRAITGLEHLDKVIDIDQAPIGRTPRSNPATYTGVFTPIRELFAMLPESRERGYRAGRFSFNVKGGRCEACQGEGLRRIEMNFLPDVFVTCEVCRGRRYNAETLAVKYKGVSIADLLEMTAKDALPLLENIPQIRDQARNARRRRLGLRPAGPTRHHAFRGGGAAHQAGPRTEPAPDRPHLIYSRRAHYRTSLRRREATVASPQPPDRPWEHRHCHRASSRCGETSRLGHRPGAGRRRKRRPYCGPRHSGRGGSRQEVLHRPGSGAVAERPFVSPANVVH